MEDDGIDWETSDWSGERRAETDRRALLSDRDKVDPTDRETLIRLKQENDSKREGRIARRTRAVVSQNTALSENEF